LLFKIKNWAVWGELSLHFVHALAMNAPKAPRLPHRWLYVGANLLVALLYYELANLSRNLASTPNSVTPVWPPDGLAVGAVLLFGNGMLPGVFVGSFLANIQAFWNLQNGLAFSISVMAVLGIAAGTTTGTWLGAFLLRRTTQHRPPLGRVSDVLKFLVYCGMLGPVVNATVGVAMLGIADKAPWSAYFSIWPVWWVSNVAGIFTLTPVLLSLNDWLRSQPAQPEPRPRHLLARFAQRMKIWAMPPSRRWMEIGVLLGCIVLAGYAAFWGSHPIAYMLIAGLIWAAFRFGAVGVTLMSLLISAIAVMGTVRGLGKFANSDLNQSLLGLQSFIIVMVLTSLVLVAVLAEREQAEQRLRTAFAELQRSNAALERHTQELAANNQQLEHTLQELGKTQAQMIQSEKMSALGNLVAGVAHEINNPVGFLQGNIQPALDYIADLLGLVDLYQTHYSQPDPEIQTTIKTIDLDFLRDDLPALIDSMRTGVDRIQMISASLRTFSRADSDRPVSCNIHDGLDSTLLILKHRLKANEQRPAIEVITEYGDIPLVECYAGQLNQVFMNILANATDALDESCYGLSFHQLEAKPRQIIVMTECSADQKSVMIHFKDNGLGMSDAVKAKIFDHLFTTKDVGKGTGLGLAIAHQIVTEKHNGTLEVHSTPGCGSEFVMTLPVRFEAA
jgi:two-component system, NtrC family, sensor kinase